MSQAAHPQDAVLPRQRRRSRSEIPLTVYGVIFLTMAIVWIYQELHQDVALGMFTELLGAAFTLFIIDTLLVRAKTRRWRLVQAHVDYLVARDVHRLRDGLATRVFGFDPDIVHGRADAEQLAAVRTQRAELLRDMERKGPDLERHLREETLFTPETYAYLDAKADDIWAVLNMKYSEYMEPSLVSSLMRLHTHLKDLGAHLRQYARAERFPDDADYYRRIGRLGAAASIHAILQSVNELKRHGYSEPAHFGIPAH